MMRGPSLNYRGLQRAAGEWPSQVRAIIPDDEPLQNPAPVRPERPCARCGRTFQPTPDRAMLCQPCHQGGEAKEPRGDAPWA